MIYSQLFQTLYYMADRVHGGALPVPVNCIMDEFPNVSLPNEFEKILQPADPVPFTVASSSRT